MKKLIILLSAALLLSGCAKQTAAELPRDEAAESAVTLGDVFGEDAAIYSSAYNEERYVCVFEKDNTLMRVIAHLTPEVYQALHSTNAADASVSEILSTMEVTAIVDLTAGMPTQSDLDRLIGKTGGELLDSGWEIVGHTIYNDFESATIFYLVNGLYAYTVAFEEAVTVDNDFKESEAMRPLTVTSVTCDGVSDHCFDLNYAAK